MRPRRQRHGDDVVTGRSAEKLDGEGCGPDCRKDECPREPKHEGPAVPGHALRGHTGMVTAGVVQMRLTGAKIAPFPGAFRPPQKKMARSDRAIFDA
ncbi:hypothetical protein GCM10008942_40710 [Rhizomicrobium electricum]|uniref:Uncharacterized protein n=1 Tax=Rhizomicrobium electricum TaxID=480070 RepID=A0ABP3QFA3_9PROT